MGKGLKEFLMEEIHLDENEAQKLISVACSIQNYNATLFNVLAADTKIFQWSGSPYVSCDELQRRLSFLHELKLVECTPEGRYALTKKGNSYFNQKP